RRARPPLARRGHRGGRRAQRRRARRALDDLQRRYRVGPPPVGHDRPATRPPRRPPPASPPRRPPRPPPPPRRRPAGRPRPRRPLTMRVHVLREYALIADGERGALVGPEGELAWLCFPRWDSPAVLAGLIGGDGTYAVTPR